MVVIEIALMTTARGFVGQTVQIRLIEEFVARGARITAASHFVTLMLQPPTTPVK